MRPLGRAAILLAALLALARVATASAATLDLRVTDKLDLAAPSVSSFPAGTSSIVAAASYRDVGRGATIDLALVDAGGNRVAAYSEPIWEGGSGTVLAKLIANGPLQPGSYRLVASTPGTSPVEVPIAVGVAAQTPPASPTPNGGGGGAAPGEGGAPPAQLPRGTTQLPTLSSRQLSGGGDRPFVPVGPPPSRAPSPRFGLANILPDGATVPGVPASGSVAWMARARDAGAGGNRWEFRWEAIEARAGVYDWADADRVVAANEAAGLPLLAILIGTPPWAGPAAGAPPRGLEVGPIMPDGTISDANPWGRFVHAFASRYRGRVAAYEVWNEPNRADFWSGSPAEYYRLLSTAMAAIRHADPGATVVFGGLDGYRDLRFLEGVLDAAAADPAPPGRRGAFDALAWHAYHRPVDVYTGTWALRDRLRARGLPQPIWITETNVAAWDARPVRGDGAAPYRFSATAEEQAAFVLEALAYALAADVERIFFYRASDAGENEAWGLLQIDGGARPAERAFRFASELLAGVRAARRIGGDGIERIVLDRPGARLTVAWATGPADAPLVFEASGPSVAQLRDKIGGLGSVAPIDGRIVLSLPGASASHGAQAGDYLIGGDPYVIVETVP
ncbi:MAG TPA: hypothetical protein VGL23_15675 [Chloroflexota bacterium]